MLTPLVQTFISIFLDEKYGCSEGCYYVPGKYVEYDGVKDLILLSNILYNVVISLSNLMITGKCQNNKLPIS